MGAQGGRDWASSGRLVRPLLLTEWGAWKGRGKGPPSLGAGPSNLDGEAGAGGRASSLLPALSSWPEVSAL